MNSDSNGSAWAIGDPTLPETDTVSNPPARSLPDLFPPHMCSAIKKIGDQAAIEMVFPYSLGMLCMSLRILSNKIENLAMVLFGIHVETEDGLRYLLFNGRRVYGPELSFQGSSAQGMQEVLGKEVSEFIKVSPARKKELDHRIRLTKWVTMQMSNRPEDDGILNISMGLNEGYQIKERLWNSST